MQTVDDDDDDDFVTSHHSARSYTSGKSYTSDRSHTSHKSYSKSGGKYSDDFEASRKTDDDGSDIEEDLDEV